MWLPSGVTNAVDRKNIEVFYVNRATAKIWNDARGPGDLRFFSGWYWCEMRNGRVSSKDNGPFHSKSAAYKDAFLEMGLRMQAQQQAQVVRGSNVVQLPQKATSSGATKKRKETQRAKAAKRLIARTGGNEQQIERRLRRMGLA